MDGDPAWKRYLLLVEVAIIIGLTAWAMFAGPARRLISLI